MGGEGKGHRRGQKDGASHGGRCETGRRGAEHADWFTKGYDANPLDVV